MTLTIIIEGEPSMLIALLRDKEGEKRLDWDRLVSVTYVEHIHRGATLLTFYAEYKKR